MSENHKELTKEIANFVVATRLENTPRDVIERGQIHLLDALGLGIAGTESAVFKKIKTYIGTGNKNKTSSILCNSLQVSASSAALANGTAMHADNYDDTNPQPTPDRNGGIHAGAVVIPAALAVGEALGATGAELSAAMHCGLEVACKLNHGINARHYQSGYHATSSLGIFGATAAAARLLKLDEAGVINALAIATAKAGGIRGNFGTMTEQIHCGTAAESGVAAAEMARSGITGAPAIFERKNGWFGATAGGFIPEAICGKLGKPWAIVDPGTSIKPWPNGALTHPAMELMLKLMSENEIKPDKIQEISVQTNQRVRETLVHDNPNNASEARFSMPFALAALVLNGHAGLRIFSDQMVTNPAIKALMRKINFSSYSQIKSDYSNVTSLIKLRMNDGQVINGRADFARGSKNAPMNWEEIEKKFRECADHGAWPCEKQTAILSFVRDLESSPNLEPLMSALTI
ncbi:MAG: MmgE/PrpD family protein [Pseudomonadota bacterium]|jgi:2-methylcitrate dehydratase PrpD|nr:MmgE/PrpD family protein [Pseudomonadota bacterium]